MPTETGYGSYGNLHYGYDDGKPEPPKPIAPPYPSQLKVTVELTREQWLDVLLAIRSSYGVVSAGRASKLASIFEYIKKCVHGFSVELGKREGREAAAKLIAAIERK